MKHAPQPPIQFDVISIGEEMARQAFGNAYMNLMVLKLGSATNCEWILNTYGLRNEHTHCKISCGIQVQGLLMFCAE